jgi:hypothetical protein
MTYGFGTRSYNRSAEARENKRARAEATAKYLDGPKKESIAPLLCRCRSWEFPHELEQHRQLSCEYDWPTSAERLNRHREYWEHAL